MDYKQQKLPVWAKIILGFLSISLLLIVIITIFLATNKNSHKKFPYLSPKFNPVEYMAEDGQRSQAVKLNNDGLLLEEKGDMIQAEANYREAIAIYPSLKNPYNNLGIILTKKEKYTEAESIFIKALEIDPEYKNVYHNLGKLYLDTEKYTEAIDIYQKLTKIEPSNYMPEWSLGFAYYMAGDKQNALKHYQRAYDLGAKEKEILDVIKDLSRQI